MKHYIGTNNPMHAQFNALASYQARHFAYAFSSGVATVTNLAFSEVGIITLTPSVADGDYLGAGNVTGTVTVPSTSTGNIGRFFPAQFGLSAGSVVTRNIWPAPSASEAVMMGVFR